MCNFAQKLGRKMCKTMYKRKIESKLQKWQKDTT